MDKERILIFTNTPLIKVDIFEIIFYFIIEISKEKILLCYFMLK